VGLRRTPAARTIARLISTDRDSLSKAETLTIAAIEDGIPALVEARAAVAEFQTMNRRKAGGELDGWINRAKASLLASFANGVTKDRAAVAAAITNIWSNGQTVRDAIMGESDRATKADGDADYHPTSRSSPSLL